MDRRMKLKIKLKAENMKEGESGECETVHRCFQEQ